MARCMRATFLIKTSMFGGGREAGICRIEKLAKLTGNITCVYVTEKRRREEKKRNANHSYE